MRAGTDLSKKNGPLATPIYQTSTFEVTDSEQQVRATHTDMFYTRYGNPTHTVVENAIAELEGTDAALLFASGMTAITTTMLALVKSGDHIVAQRDIYGGVTKFLTSGCRSSGWRRRLWTPPITLSTRARCGPTRNCCILESPTNPTLRIVDLHKVVAVAEAAWSHHLD